MHVGPGGGRGAEARAHLVAGDDRLEQAPPGGAGVLRHRQRGGDHVDGRMTAAEATPAVELANVASSGSTCPPWPISVEAARDRRATMSSASRRFSGCALPAAI